MVRESVEFGHDTTSFGRNRYWVLSHGKSIPNEKGLIVSSTANNIPLENFRICHSPFSRTTHTSKVVASMLNLPFEGPQCKVMEDLRECFFGPSLELMSHDKVTLDEKDPFMRPVGGESVNDFASRLSKAMATMESEFMGVEAVRVPSILSQHRKFGLLPEELRAVI
ncbi:hypothetical protein I3843_05G080400 [Carya illinoinensis]|nr:hypothetical protein I3843_05G080400 [Carya illinoinensis]